MVTLVLSCLAAAWLAACATAPVPGSRHVHPETPDLVQDPRALPDPALQPPATDRDGIHTSIPVAEPRLPGTISTELWRCSGLVATAQADCGGLSPPPGLLDNPFPLRPPLRRLWFQHPRLVPLGDDAELNIADSEILAHRHRASSLPLKNPYGGFHDHPVLHRDTSRAPITDSTLPEIGPPPPKHSIKTLLTLGGLSLVGAGVYAFAPTAFTGSKKEGQWEDAWGHFKEGWTKPPVFDKDPATVNYLGHPYFGANFYLSQRNVGESPLYSFFFSVFCSTFFEYMIESWSERPSINDLIITPVVGSILGELVYRATQEMRKDGFTKAEKIVVTIINPLYVLENGYH
jgi:hypothetical protein